MAAHFVRNTPKKPGQHRWICKADTFKYTVFECNKCGAKQKSWNAHPCRHAVWVVDGRTYQAREDKPACI